MIDEEDKAQGIRLCEIRKSYYDMLASLYFGPLTADQIETMAQTDFRQFDTGNELMEAGFNDITRFLRKRHSGTRQMLAVDYTGSFGGTTAYKGKVAVPYASVYLSKNGLLNQEPRNEVYFAYRKERLSVKSKSIPADHLSFELEFMGVMSQRAQEALEREDYAAAAEALKTSKSFLNDYILTWFPLLKERALQMISTRFYRGVLSLTEGYFQLDGEVLDDMLEKLEESEVAGAPDAARAKQSAVAHE